MHIQSNKNYQYQNNKQKSPAFGTTLHTNTNFARNIKTYIGNTYPHANTETVEPYLNHVKQVFDARNAGAPGKLGLHATEDGLIGLCYKTASGIIKTITGKDGSEPVTMKAEELLSEDANITLDRHLRDYIGEYIARSRSIEPKGPFKPVFPGAKRHNSLEFSKSLLITLKQLQENGGNAAV